MILCIIYLSQKKNKDKFLNEFCRIKTSIKNGTTPVYCELRSAKTQLVELIPYLLIQSIFLILSTLLVSQLDMTEITRLVVLLAVNSASATLTNCLWTIIKHGLRISCLRRFDLEPTEENIAVLECMEYQSV